MKPICSATAYATALSKPLPLVGSSSSNHGGNAGESVPIVSEPGVCRLSDSIAHGSLAATLGASVGAAVGVATRVVVVLGGAHAVAKASGGDEAGDVMPRRRRGAGVMAHRVKRMNARSGERVSRCSDVSRDRSRPGRGRAGRRRARPAPRWQGRRRSNFVLARSSIGRRNSTIRAGGRRRADQRAERHRLVDPVGRQLRDVLGAELDVGQLLAPAHRADARPARARVRRNPPAGSGAAATRQDSAGPAASAGRASPAATLPGRAAGAVRRRAAGQAESPRPPP